MMDFYMLFIHLKIPLVNKIKYITIIYGIIVYLINNNCSFSRI